MTREFDLEMEIRQLARRFGPNRKAMEEFARAIDQFDTAMDLIATERLPDAVAPLDQAVSIARELRVPAFQARCAEKLAMIWRNRGLHDEAILMGTLALGLTTCADVRINTHNSLAVVYLTANEPLLARMHAYADLELLATIPDSVYKACMVAASLYNVGESYLRERTFAKAAPLIHTARGMFEKLEMIEGVAKADTGIGAIAFAAGRLDEAETHLKKALATFEQTKNEMEIAITLHGLARLEAARGNISATMAHATRAAAIHRRIGRNDLAMKVMADVAAMEKASRKVPDADP